MTTEGVTPPTYRHRFSLLLIALFAHLLMVALAGHFPALRGVVTAVFIVFLGFAINAVSARRRDVVFCGALVACFVLSRVADELFAQEFEADNPGTFFAFRLGAHIAGVLLLLLVSVLILEHVFQARTVTSNTIAAALSVYILLGLTWAVLYSLVELFSPAAFSRSLGGAADGAEAGAVVYFSFVTLTTLGYGDITPVTAVAQMLCVIEGITGQIYLTVLVARLVGLHIAHFGTGDDR